MNRYKVTFTTGEKFTMTCIDGFSPQQAISDWQNPALPPDNIQEIIELLTEEDYIAARNEIENQ